MITPARAIPVLLLLVLAAGCRPQIRGSIADTEPAPTLVWPSPPAQPRIRFLKVIGQPADLGIEPSFWQRVGEFFAGKDEDWFIRPTGVAARGEVLYVADPGAPALWVLDAPARRVRRIRQAGTQNLVSPVAVALGRDRQVYVADSVLAAVFLHAADGALEGTVRDPGLVRPAGLAYDAARDRLYVADSAAHRVWVFSGDGRLHGSLGQRGVEDGEFNFPTHLALDRNGLLYVTDALAYRIQIFSPDGMFVGKFGQHGDASGNFASPKGVAVDSQGHVYVAEALFDAVQIFGRQGRYLLGFGERGLGPGQFWLPGGLFIDESDRVYVADAYNQRVQVFQYLAEGGR